MHDTKLASMLNQIVAFHRRKPPAEAAAEVATHLERFWEPRMRASIYEHLAAGGEGMSEVGKAAVSLLQARDARKAVFDPA